jgi:thioredoxin 1
MEALQSISAFFKRKPFLLVPVLWVTAKQLARGPDLFGALYEMLGALYSLVYQFVTEQPLICMIICYMVYQMFRASQPFPESGGRVKSIHTEEEWQKVKQAGVPFVVDFYAKWCPPCRTAAPWYGELSLAHKKLEFYKVDVDEARLIMTECGVTAMPTFKRFDKKGVEIGEVRGFSKPQIEAMLAAK